MLESETELRKFKRTLAKVNKIAPAGASTHIHFQQRHFSGRTNGIQDATTKLNISMLRGVDGYKENPIWWNLLREVAASKNKYNYQLGIGYNLPYNKIPDLGTAKALNLILKCYKSLKPVYELVTED